MHSTSSPAANFSFIDFSGMCSSSCDVLGASASRDRVTRRGFMAHAPLDMLKSVRRFGDTFLGAEEEESGWGCRVDPTHFGCNRLGTLEFNALHTSIYIGTATATIAYRASS